MNDVAAALDLLGAELRAALRIPPDERLWSIADIAAYSGFSKIHTETAIITLAGFPKPVRPTGPTGQPRWVSHEVMDWFKGRRWDGKNTAN